MSPGRDVHPGDDRHRLEAYLADRLGAEERIELEAHVADCKQCRRRLVELHLELAEVDPAVGLPERDVARARELAGARPFGSTPGAGPLQPVSGSLETSPGQARRASMLPMIAAGLAAAVLGGGLWMLWDRPTPEAATAPAADGQVFRFEATVQSLELLSPADGAVLPPGPVDLKWTPVVDAVVYWVIVLDPAGAPIARHRVEAPSWRWTDGAGDTFWYVEAELADGSRLESEARRLTFAPAGSGSPGGR